MSDDRRLHQYWEHMKRVCFYEKSPSYQYYGAKGVTVCDQWVDNYQAFKQWSLDNGYTERATLERRDMTADFSPANCFWKPLDEGERYGIPYKRRPVLRDGSIRYPSVKEAAKALLKEGRRFSASRLSVASRISKACLYGSPFADSTWQHLDADGKPIEAPRANDKKNDAPTWTPSRESRIMTHTADDPYTLPPTVNRGLYVAQCRTVADHAAPRITEQDRHESGTVGKALRRQRADAVARRLLSSRTEATERRNIDHAIARLSPLTWEEFDHFIHPNTSNEDRNMLIWAALCRRSTFLSDFAHDVLRDQWLLGQKLTCADYDRFWRHCMMWHVELEDVSDRMFRQMRSNVFRMMRELGVLDESGIVYASLPSDGMRDLLTRTGELTELFPVF